jgi:3-hydroxyisobutyrate dehydrogenase-like beta-hydroxyacid dehydrogenase
MTTIGLLYPGELGAALASLLIKRGLRVVTTVNGRSGRTVERARLARMEVVPSLADVVRQAEIVISLVPPSAAIETADAWCALAASSPAGAIYVDMNSIGPELAATLARKVEAHGRDFVDAAINGSAANVAKSGTLFLSGQRAAEIAAFMGDSIRTKVLGDQPGRASAMKMLLSGISKGLCALFVETAVVARRQDMLGEMIEAATGIYPGVMAVVERMLPTYAQHAARRATETSEMEETARACGLDPFVLSAVRELHARLAEMAFEDSPPAGWSVSNLIERIDSSGMLSEETAKK